MVNNENEFNLNGQPPPDEDGSKLKKVNIERYRDDEGLTVKRLDFGLWLVEHKHQLVRFFVFILIFISVISWGYFIYGFGYYIIYGIDEDRRLADGLVNTGNIDHSYFVAHAAQDLVVYAPSIINTGMGNYDFLAKIQNPNQKHWADFNFAFYAGGREVADESGFILPGETKYVAALARTVDSNPANAQFKLTSISWHRIDPHAIADVSAFQKERLAISIEDTSFNPAVDTANTDQVKLNNLEFRATNNSAYSFWSAGFTILLYQRGAIVGVNKYTLDDFLSQTSRDVSISWPGRFGKIDTVEVFPDVNIMDPANYISPQGGTGTQK